MLTNEIHIYSFFTIDDVLVGKVTISARLKKIDFPKISEQAPLTDVGGVLELHHRTFCGIHSDCTSKWDCARAPKTHQKAIETVLQNKLLIPNI